MNAIDQSRHQQDANHRNIGRKKLYERPKIITMDNSETKSGYVPWHSETAYAWPES